MSLQEENTNNEPNLIKNNQNGQNDQGSINIQIEEEKKYVNFYFCSISLSIVIAYIFVICSISINILNRVLFYQYEFEFEILLIFFQELFNSAFYLIASRKSEKFKKLSGEISFKDFYKLKFQYFGYSLFEILHSLISLFGYQLVKNIPMYVNLRKFVTVMIFSYQFFIKKKKIEKINIIVVILLTLGAILAGIDDYDTDVIGYIVIFCKNTMSVINLEISENFKKFNGVSNVKLLAYKSFICPPLLIIIMFIFGENRELVKYLKADHNFSFVSLFILLIINFIIILTSNICFFMSNEKNNSLFTQLLSDSKYIFITLLSFFILKTFTFTWKNVLGLIISTFGAMIISVSSVYKNIEFKKKIKAKKKKFVELTNIDEKEFNDDNKNININDSKDEINDTDASNNSMKSTEENSINDDTLITNNDNLNISNENNITNVNNDNLNISNENNIINANNEDKNELKNEINASNNN